MIFFKKYFIISLIIIILFNSHQSLFAKGKNLNIEKAKELVKEKKYNDALKILVDELIKDESNEDLIMSLIEKIENEKEKIIGMIFTAKEKIKEGDFKKAEEIIDQLSESGDFDKTINDIVKAIEREKEPLKKINNFNQIIVNHGEKYLVAFDIENALKSYNSAMDIYRVKKINFSNKNFNNAIIKFNSAEQQLLNSGIEKYNLNINEKYNYNILLNEKNKLEVKINDWKRFESNLINIQNLLYYLDNNSKKLIEYEAYNSITDKYINTIRRTIQKHSLNLMKFTMNLAEKNISLFETGVITKFEGINDIINLLIQLENSSYYRIVSDLKDEIITERSKNNLTSYLNYLTKKNIFSIKIEEIKVIKDINDINNLFALYNEKNKDKKLLEAEKALKNADTLLTNFYPKKENLDLMLEPFAELKIDEFNKFNKNNNQLKTETDELKKKITQSMDKLKRSIEFANRILKEADDLYNYSSKLLNSKTYDNAKENFEKSKEKYIETSLVIKYEYIDNQIDKINKNLDYIEKRIFHLDMEKAEKYLENAITKLYIEKYDEAKEDINEADKIYTEYKQDKEIIEFYRKRILTALMIKSGSKLSIDDQTYEEIIELMNNAKHYFKNKDFTKALEFIYQVLFEKPYYEDARLFEVKILKEVDIEKFETVYSNYFQKAKANFDNKIYSEALIEFKQLLQFNKNTNLIRKYINNCKVKLGLIKPVLTEKEKNYAYSLVKEANNNYASGNFQESYNKANLALKIWRDVPGGRTIRSAARDKLGFAKPKLTRDNEIRWIQAQNAYGETNFEKAYKLTSEILKTQDFDYVKNLNKIADKRRQKK